MGFFPDRLFFIAHRFVFQHPSPIYFFTPYSIQRYPHAIVLNSMNFNIDERF